MNNSSGSLINKVRVTLTDLSDGRNRQLANLVNFLSQYQI